MVGKEVLKLQDTKRTMGEPLQVDELRGQNGYVDRVSPGVTTGDVIRLMFRRSRAAFLMIAFFLVFFPILLLPVDPIAFLVFLGMILFFLVIMVGTFALAILCSGKNAAKMLMENNYILVLKDRLVIQSQADMMMIVLRNEVPVSNIAGIQPVPEHYFTERRSKTNLCTRVFTGMYIPPVGGLYPMAAKNGNLMVIHLKKPHEIHCSGRSHNGMFQLGDKREYVKEIIISVEPLSQGRLISHLVSRSM